MKIRNLGLLVFVCVLCAIVLAGCETGDNSPGGFTGNIKSQGVYTTLALTGHGLDMPGPGYLQKGSFGPGETPAAVIVGYGSYNQEEQVLLELIESSTGRSLFSKDYNAAYGKAFVQPLAVRLSGNYELRLTTGGARLDNCLFTVTRTNNSSAMPVPNASPAAKYAEGVFFISIEADSLSSPFNEYDERLNYTMLNAVTKAAGSTNRDLFAQRFPGRVVIQCRLDSQGRLTAPKILENTLDDDCGEVFTRALLERSPYAVWPEDLHQKAGSDFRTLTVTIQFG